MSNDEEKQIKQKETKIFRKITNSRKWEFDIDLQTQKEYIKQINAAAAAPATIVKQIKAKLNGYKYQDKIKGKPADAVISLDETLKLLEDSDLSCFYCHCDVYVLYDYAYQSRQWTLERIDNSQGHVSGNVQICCLKCNLKRRIMFYKKYIESQKMIIVNKLPEEIMPHPDST